MACRCIALLAMVSMAFVVAVNADCGTPPNPDKVANTCDGVAYDFSNMRGPTANYFLGAGPAGYDYYIQFVPPGLPPFALANMNPKCIWDNRTEWENGNVGGQAAGDDSGTCYPIGKVNNQAWSNPGNGTIVVKFSGGQDTRTTTVFFKCDPSKSVPSFTALGEQNLPDGSTYEIDIVSDWTCPGGHKAPASSGSVGGWIVIGIFFGGLAIYFVAGFLFFRFKEQKEGREAIPHLEFWMSLPGLVKSGGAFTLDKVRGKSGGTYESI